MECESLLSLFPSKLASTPLEAYGWKASLGSIVEQDSVRHLEAKQASRGKAKASFRTPK
jgi:hypothetical protein